MPTSDCLPTLFLCTNIIDRFLSAQVVSLATLQLVGITCLFVASKIEEIVAPSVSHFPHCTDSSYTESEILLGERYVLKTMDWNLSFPNQMHFLRRISKADGYDLKSRTMGKYLLEVAFTGHGTFISRCCGHLAVAPHFGP